MGNVSVTYPPETALDILRKNGRSFNFARTFLTEVQGQRAARLYAFCRYIDDLADETPDKSRAKAELEHVKAQLTHSLPPSVRIADFLRLAEETSLSLEVASALVDGVMSDLSVVAFETTPELVRYAYKVAGTVGLMMCSVLDVEDPRAAPFAIDLGVAMQLTNIARDIHEDALNGRRYVPGAWLGGATASQIANPDPLLKLNLQEAANRLIELAEIYYESAYEGFGYLPARARFAILIAARVYRQIGLKLRRQGFAVWNGRTVVSTSKKVAESCSASAFFLTNRRLHRRSQKHDVELHSPLKGLAGVHEAAI